LNNQLFWLKARRENALYAHSNDATNNMHNDMQPFDHSVNKGVRIVSRIFIAEVVVYPDDDRLWADDGFVKTLHRFAEILLNYRVPKSTR
jgi:hypothetical protein